MGFSVVGLRYIWSPHWLALTCCFVLANEFPSSNLCIFLSKSDLVFVFFCGKFDH